ncbi:MAG: MotA/TolQ/ExbB proton channel family protein [Gammaproteobacteria bacterium]|nr:MotA/TolQ/ExbB proton channel family protein [Gammaproteobacteria bacterium]
MIELSAPWIAIRSFFEAGGNVLWGIFAATIIMWTLIIERLWFFRTAMPPKIEAAHREWLERPERSSWYSRQIRRQLISEISIAAHHNIGTIHVLMAILPLLGLLGTVTGMIQVFNVMATAGTSNARLMASGVSAATLPTMAGLVASLSGLYLGVFLKRRADMARQFIADTLSE